MGNQDKEPLAGASVFWLGNSKEVVTGKNGEFRMSAKDDSNRKLVASHVGHSPDTVDVTNRTIIEILLKETGDMDELVVRSQREGVFISDVKADSAMPLEFAAKVMPFIATYLTSRDGEGCK